MMTTITAIVNISIKCRWFCLYDADNTDIADDTDYDARVAENTDNACEYTDNTDNAEIAEDVDGNTDNTDNADDDDNTCNADDDDNTYNADDAADSGKPGSLPAEHWASTPQEVGPSPIPQ